MKPKGSLDDRLLEILFEGGARKVSILEAWAKAAGYGEIQLGLAIDRLERRGIVCRFEKRGPASDESGTRVALTMSEARIAAGKTAGHGYAETQLEAVY